MRSERRSLGTWRRRNAFSADRPFCAKGRNAPAHRSPCTPAAGSVRAGARARISVQPQAPHPSRRSRRCRRPARGSLARIHPWSSPRCASGRSSAQAGPDRLTEPAPGTPSVGACGAKIVQRHDGIVCGVVHDVLLVVMCTANSTSSTMRAVVMKCGRPISAAAVGIIRLAA